MERAPSVFLYTGIFALEVIKNVTVLFNGIIHSCVFHQAWLGAAGWTETS